MSWHRKKFDRDKRTSGRRWVGMRHVVLVEEPVCRVCLRRPAVQVDHIIPLCKGGTDSRDNLQGICIECHDTKTRKDLGLKEAKKIGLDGYPIENKENAVSH